MAGESSVQASSPLEMKGLGPFDQKLAMAKRCGHGNAFPSLIIYTFSSSEMEGVVAGARAAVVATVASVVPTLASVRMVPWARRNLNPTAQALIVSLAMEAIKKPPDSISVINFAGYNGE
ncbi:Early nodulin-93 [Nymphaea thermarum]|nr:Early nodulin-93 [Nymphaea thermarum]